MLRDLVTSRRAWSRLAAALIGLLLLAHLVRRAGPAQLWEGIASVGLTLAPLSALVCGLVIAVSNRLSSGLPPRFVLLSSGVLPHIFLNVPFSTTLLSHGAAVLFLLWYVTPRAVFNKHSQARGLPSGEAAPVI